MTGTDVARFTHKQSRSYLNHLVLRCSYFLQFSKVLKMIEIVTVPCKCLCIISASSIEHGNDFDYNTSASIEQNLE